ncbi:MAG TPA: GvpL/GvpF family gas vesicle protein, partial [Vicinamibacteria bacterium]|nr:GvpL/GvpF family gas vesicle protein [Vicinamibacteria bacterium]
ARSAARARAADAAASLRAGSRFLARKRQEHDEVRDIVRVGRDEAEVVFRDAARHASDTRRRDAAAGAPGTRLVLDAAFLVPVAEVGAFKETLRRHGERLSARGYRLVLTGPWPAYNFVDEVR